MCTCLILFDILAVYLEIRQPTRAQYMYVHNCSRPCRSITTLDQTQKVKAQCMHVTTRTNRMETTLELPV